MWPSSAKFVHIKIKFPISLMLLLKKFRHFEDFHGKNYIVKRNEISTTKTCFWSRDFNSTWSFSLVNLSTKIFQTDYKTNSWWTDTSYKDWLIFEDNIRVQTIGNPKVNTKSGFVCPGMFLFYFILSFPFSSFF